MKRLFIYGGILLIALIATLVIILLNKNDKNDTLKTLKVADATLTSWRHLMKHVS